MRIQLRRTAGQVEGLHPPLLQQREHLVHRVPRHQLGALGTGIHVTVHAAEVAQVAQVDLQGVHPVPSDGGKIGGE